MDKIKHLNNSLQSQTFISMLYFYCMSNDCQVQRPYKQICYFCHSYKAFQQYMEIVLQNWCWNCYLWYHSVHLLKSVGINFISDFCARLFLVCHKPHSLHGFVHQVPGTEHCSLECKLIGDITEFSIKNLFLISG